MRIKRFLNLIFTAVKISCHYETSITASPTDCLMLGLKALMLFLTHDL